MSGHLAANRSDVPDHVVAAVGGVMALILGEDGAGRYRVTSIRPLGWHTEGLADRTWSLAGRMDAGGVRQHFGEGRRG